MKHRVIVTPEAESDLKRIYRYIRMDGAPQAARGWLAGARKAIKALAVSPERANLAPESSSFEAPLRELLIGTSGRLNYRILFVIMGNSVFILHVRHGSMLPLRPLE